MKVALPSAALALLALTAIPLAAQVPDAPVLPLADVKAGMKGEVWTVFKGSRPESFGVEVTGLVENALGPGKNLIVCELTDPRVQNMGAVAGMSGSPLYIDGRLVGVLSYQIQRFETVRYAGFTPIADMLEVSTFPPAPKDLVAPLPIPVRRNESRTRSAMASDNWNAMRPVFSIGGVSPEVLSMAGPQLHELGLDFTTLGGHASGESSLKLAPAPDLKPGDAIAVALAVGDVTVAGTGTVSYVDGKRVLAFGHPMLRLGAVDLAMTTAEVVTILPSQYNSVKLSNSGGIIGTFSQDRLSAVYGEIGRMPPLVPVEVTFPSRNGMRTLHFAVVRHEQVLPTVAATGLAQAVTNTNESGLAKGFRVTTEVDFPGRAPIQMSQLYAGPNGFAQGLGEFTHDLTQWLFNPFERVFPDRIEFRVEETEQTPVATLESFQVSRSQAAPGDRVVASVGWRGFQQGPGLETLDIPVSADWAGKDLEVVLTTGGSLDELTGRPRTVPAAQLRSFDEYTDALRNVRETDGLYVAVVERTSVFMDQMQTTPELPGSLERIARGADEARFQRRAALKPLWERHILPDTLFNATVRRPLRVTD